MKSHILRYALYGGVFLLAVNLLMLLILGVPDADSFGTGEIVGYALIVVSLLTVFFGIRSYRNATGSALRFRPAVMVGLGITLGPSLAFALYNLIYVVWIDPGFAEKYNAYLVDQARQTMSEAALQEYALQIQSQNEFLLNPWVSSVIMFLTVFLIGAVIAVASAIILRRRKAPSPAA